MNLERRSAGSESGQALVLFAIVLVAITGMTGLVVDAGGSFAQRREQQNVADLAAMAGAIVLQKTGSTGAATAQALVVAAQNDYPSGVDGTSVSVSFPGSGRVRVTVDRPHENGFARIFGQDSWDISTSARANTGTPNAAVGAMPLLFNKKAFVSSPGVSRFYSEPPSGTVSVPQNNKSFNWTVFCTASGGSCNADTTTVHRLITQGGDDAEVTLDMMIGPLNAGSHTSLYGELNKWIGTEFPVAVVDDAGKMQGWAVFHLESTKKDGSTKGFTGYFVSPVTHSGLSIRSAAGGVNYGAYVFRLEE
ncbi:hypothetical protein BH20CHL6_BH20CHL6_16000 [soil metagenome]